MRMPAPARSTDVDLPSASPTSKRARLLMEDAGKRENGEKEPPSLQINSKWYAQSRFIVRIVVR